MTLAPWLDDGIDSSNMEFWAGLNKAVSAYLNQFTLQDLVDEEKADTPMTMSSEDIQLMIIKSMH